MEFEHQQWRGEITFWQNELISFNHRLSELITRWATRQELNQIGHYQKEFILHGQTLEDLLEIIYQQENGISANNKASLSSVGVKLSQKHNELRKQMETQRETFGELKKEFFRFLENDL